MSPLDDPALIARVEEVGRERARDVLDLPVTLGRLSLIDLLAGMWALGCRDMAEALARYHRRETASVEGPPDWFSPR